uniref:Uncharacterized protein n=1 Tax=Oryza sativa subsp. japonica TaxID=39947 RepID=Q6YYG0_ORYSJ|nr:hypothetical protein [Oryza sativa Japonica Group]BAD16268.1 hypothetical protein [Oryza sativa Japonica Group]
MPLDGDGSIPIPMVFDGGTVGVRRGGTWWTGVGSSTSGNNSSTFCRNRSTVDLQNTRTNSSFTISPARTTTVADKEEKGAVLLALVKGQEEAAALWEGQLLRQGSREIGENSAIIGVTSLASHHTHRAHQSSLSTGSQVAGHGQS